MYTNDQKPAAVSRDHRILDEHLEQFGHLMKMRENPDEKVVFPPAVVDER